MIPERPKAADADRWIVLIQNPATGRTRIFRREPSELDAQITCAKLLAAGLLARVELRDA